MIKNKSGRTIDLSEKKMLVLSGINLYEGGPLSIYYDCLDAILEMKYNCQYNVVAFVHKKELFSKYSQVIKIIELPQSRKNYFFRLYYEYIYFYFFSKKNKVDVWISLHDITPKVIANRIYTYCHNPSPFMKKNIKNVKYSFTNVMFSLFYKYLYRINIKSATAIIVQQDWIRKEFLEMYPVRNVIVAKPSIKIDFSFVDKSIENIKTCFVFAAYPRWFKNFEVICEAAKLIESYDFEIWFTINGTENRYSKELYGKYKDIKKIKWLGLKTRQEVFNLYNFSNCMIFPSTVETWGLPITEYKETGKPIILADLPYAHETVGNYKKCTFFDPNDCYMLADQMKTVILNNEHFVPHKQIPIEEPFFNNWNSLLEILLR